MAAAAPWSVKGIDPKAREVAKDLARRSGMTLGEWLNRVILEDDVPEDVASQSHFPDRPTERPRLRTEPPRAPEPSTGDFGRIARALDRLTDRIEAAETRTGLAVAGVEHSVRQAVARIDTAERTHAETAAHVQGLIHALPAGPRSPEVVRTLDHGRAAPATAAETAAALLERLGERLAEAEGHTVGMLEALRGSLAALDQRLGLVETAGDARLEALGAGLADQLADARQEFAAQLAGAGAGASEARLAQMAAQIAAVEERSTRAIEAMGREVLTLAETLGRRIQTSEQHSAVAIEQVGGEVQRFAGAVETRLGRAEQVQADALEKLGAEMGRITERLTERLLNSERRAAQAIDDVGEQMGRVTERFERRQERAATDLAERIRQSEARTAQVLGEFSRKLDIPMPFLPQIGDDEATLSLISPAPSDGPVDTPVEALLSEALAAPAFTVEDFEAAEAFAPIPEIEEDAPEAAAFLAEDEEESDGERPLSTREVIEQARAAARAADSAPSAPIAAAIPIAKADGVAAGPRRGLFGGRPKPTRRPSSALQTALMVAGGAAFLSVGAAGVVLLEGPPPAPAPIARAAVALAPQVMAPSIPAVDQTALADRYAGVLANLRAETPGALAELQSVAEAGYAPAQLFLAKLYEKGEAGVVVNPAEARKWVARAAEGGDASAMHQLAVYEFRGEGAHQNLAGAALWFRRAAERGVVDSQYNLALLYRSGSGVETNLAEAYRWFSVAAAGGDPAAAQAARELKPQLSPTELAGAEQAIEAGPLPAAPASQIAAARPATVAR